MTESIWKYEDYSAFSRQLARDYTRKELEKMLSKLEGEQFRNTQIHLHAIEKSASMTGNSQHRAQSGNVVRGNYEQCRFIKDAIEIHRYYPPRARIL